MPPRWRKVISSRRAWDEEVLRLGWRLVRRHAFRSLPLALPRQEGEGLKDYDQSAVHLGDQANERLRSGSAVPFAAQVSSL